MLPLLELLRPAQWTKNIFCLAGLIFSGNFAVPSAVMNALLATVAFCMASSCTYILNDLCDVENDKAHPRKSRRPLARGAVSKNVAVASALILAVAALCVGFLPGAMAGSCVVLYLILQFLYSFWLKKLVLIDVMCIAIGFVLRLLGGVYAVNELPTTWITLCTLFLALFLGFSKRRCEMVQQASSQSSSRTVLNAYSLPLLDSLISSSATMAVLSYALFTALSGKNPTLVLTVPIVYFAIVYYKFLLLEHRKGEEPEWILLQDRTLQLSILVWMLTYGAIVSSKVSLIR